MNQSSTTRRSCSALPLFAVVALAGMTLALSACRPPSSEWIPDEEMVSEGVLACEELLNQLERVDPEAASETELEAAIVSAERNEERCSNQLASAGSTPGERAFYQHRASELRFFVYLFEGALSRRFDEYEGYCVILRDIIELLAEGLDEMNTTMMEAGDITEAEGRRLRELMVLDLQTLELMSVEWNATCD